MKKCSTLLILIFAFMAAPALGVIQNSATPSSVGTLGDDVASTTLLVWSKWTSDKFAHKMGVIINIVSNNGFDVDRGTQIHRFDELELLADDGYEAVVQVGWTDIHTVITVPDTYTVCAALVTFHEDIGMMRGPESCRGFPAN